MTPRFVNPLPFVADIAISRDFYRDVVGLRVVEETADFVRFATGFALHDGASLLRRATGAVWDGQPFGRANLVLYFETDDLDLAFDRVAAQAVLLHRVQVQDWGGRLFRFLDPDGHIIEMGAA